MSNDASGSLEPFRESEHVLGRIIGEAGGPVIVVMAGIHGNEPAGLKAASRILARLKEDRPVVRGRLVILRGNLTALGERIRFIQRSSR